MVFHDPLDDLPVIDSDRLQHFVTMLSSFPSPVEKYIAFLACRKAKIALLGYKLGLTLPYPGFSPQLGKSYGDPNSPTVRALQR